MRTEYNNEPLFIDTDMNAVRPELPFVERNSITAVVYNPATEKYLGLKWKQVDWETFVTGGVEEGYTAEEAARAEIHEETGYKNLRLAKMLPAMHSQFFHHPKGVNRFAHFQCFLFELETMSETLSRLKSKRNMKWSGLPKKSSRRFAFRRRTDFC